MLSLGKLAWLCRRAANAVAVAVTVFTAACAPLRSVTGGSAPLPPFPAFRLEPDARPAIASGRAGVPILPADPHLYVDGDGFHLFYSTYFCRRDGSLEFTWDPEQPTACLLPRPVTSIGYAYSADRGQTWQFRRTPLILLPDTGWDAGRIETAAAFRIGDTLYLAYSADGQRNGRAFRSRYQVGIARLNLGARTIRAALMDETQRLERRPAPVLPYDLRPGRFDNNVQEPSVVVGPQGIVLFYIGLGFRNPEAAAGTPGQGIRSIGMGRAVLDHQLNVVERSSEPVLLGVNSSEVSFFHGSYHIFATTLSALPAHQGEAISYASSADGVRWTEPRVILSAGTADYNGRGLGSPSAAGDGRGVVLVYSAYGHTPGECALAGPEGRFGLPLPDESRCLYLTVGRAVSAIPGSSHER